MPWLSFAGLNLFLDFQALGLGSGCPGFGAFCLAQGVSACRMVGSVLGDRAILCKTFPDSGFPKATIEVKLLEAPGMYSLYRFIGSCNVVGGPLVSWW